MNLQHFHTLVLLIINYVYSQLQDQILLYISPSTAGTSIQKYNSELNISDTLQTKAFGSAQFKFALITHDKFISSIPDFIKFSLSYIKHYKPQQPQYKVTCVILFYGVRWAGGDGGILICWGMEHN